MAERERTIGRIRLDDIEVDAGPRPIDNDAVERLARSMADIGMHTPIVVVFERFAEDRKGNNDRRIFRVVTGRHRIAAARSLGWDEIEAIRFDESRFVENLPEDVDLDVYAEMWAIAENLHRAELTALERDTQVARWIELSAERVSVQSAPKPQGGRPESGINAASRELGIESTDAKRAVKVAGLSDEAKEAAREAGLDDNRSAMLEAARKPTVAEQVAAIHERAQAKAKPAKLADEPLNDFEAREKQVAALMSAWNKASPEAREEFMRRVDTPVMDRRYG